jgi:hypothetical protein
VINAAASASPLDVSLAGSTTLATGLEFAENTDYVNVPGGAGTLTVAAPGAPAEVPIDLSPGSVYTVLVLDRDGGGGGVAVEIALDAAGPGVVPTGGVEAGAGGTAAGTDGRAMVGLTVAAVTAVAAVGLLLTALLRRPDRGRAPRHAAS